MNLRVNINVCRVCMKTDSGVSLYDDKELNEMFVYTTGLKLTKNDEMPSIICMKCQKRLRLSFGFVKMAHESENNLKAFLVKISKDFQLVTNSTLGKDECNSDEDLLATILEEESIDKIPDVTQKSLKRLNSEQKYHSLSSSPLLCYSDEANIRKSSNSETHDIQIPTTAKKLKLKNKEEISTQDEVKRESKDQSSKDFELFDHDLEVNIEPEDVDDVDDVDDVNLHKFSDVDDHNDNIPDEDIQMLEYTDEESNTELEILEENLQGSDNTHSSLDRMEQPQPSNDGFLNEYQTMMKEEDEYLEDTNTIPIKAATKENGMPLYEASEAIEKDTKQELKPIEEAHTKEKEDEEPVSQDINTTVENAISREKTKRSSIKSSARSSSTKHSTQEGSSSTSKRFYCFKCNRDFSTKTNLNRHMATHEGNRPFQCVVCNKSFSQNVSLKLHMYTHTGEKPYQCEVCKRGFTQCKSLVFHLRRHTGEKPFPCEQCGALFRQKDGLKTHILKRHTIKSQDGSTELITCAICKEDLSDKGSLQEHMKKHLNDYVRVDSSMSFSNRETNTDDTQQNLLECIHDDPLIEKDSVFINEPLSVSTDDINTAAHVVDLMTTSAMVPSRAKKFQCRKCFKCFAIKKNLLRHLTTHDITISTEEEFQCKLCALSFDSSEELRAHTLGEHNSTEELFQCELCQLVFTSTEKLQKHSNIQHSYKCDVCSDIQFTTRRLLMEHMMEHDLNEIQ